MQKVVSPDKEPITPFLSRARDLYEQAGISTILVAGSSGAFFHIADTVIQMDRYKPVDITKKGEGIVQRISDFRRKATSVRPATQSPDHGKR